MGEWKIRQFNLAFNNFYANCGVDMQEAVDECLNRFYQVGNLIRPPYSKHLEDKIFEFRPSTHEEEGRLLYFYGPEPRTVIIAVAFKKKTRKTPRDKIDQAKQARKLVLADPEKSHELDN